jgi:hypothetical protein
MYIVADLQLQQGRGRRKQAARKREEEAASSSGLLGLELGGRRE